MNIESNVLAQPSSNDGLNTYLHPSALMAKGSASDLLNTIYKDYMGSEGQGKIEVRAIYNGIVKQEFFSNIEDAIQFGLSLNNNFNIFFGVTPRVGGKKKDVRAVTVLWVDIDYGEFGHNKKSKYKTKEDALAAISGFPIPPSVIVHTGGGFHVYWLLSKPITLSDKGDISGVEAILKGLASAIGGDCTYDVSRVMRMPDTYNLKEGKKRICEFIDFHPDRRYELIEFKDYAIIGHAEQECEVDFSNTTVEVPKLGELSAKLSFNTMDIIGGQVSKKYESRSEADYAVIGALINAGYVDNSIKAILDTYPCAGKYREKKQQGHGESWLSNAIKKLKASNAVLDGGNLSLPEIITNNRQLREVSDDAKIVLEKANNPPSIFLRNNSLVEIRETESGVPVICELSETRIRSLLSRTANFYRRDKKGILINVSPPKDVVQDIVSRNDMNFPRITGVTGTPIIHSNGEIIKSEGYDSVTKLYYQAFRNCDIPDIPHNPTVSDIANSLTLINDLLCDFPFDGIASKANALALILTPLLRPIFSGPVPLALVDKPQAGTGATLFVTASSLIATGCQPYMMNAPLREEEWSKLITSILIEGRQIIVLDNLENTLKSPSLAMTLTSENYQGRLLGKSKMVAVEHQSAWIATGNNIKLGGDLARRCYMIRMDAKLAKPWQRATFKHQDLIKWAQKNRGELVSACLTLARAWIRAGKPEAINLPVINGFNEWSRTIGGILAFAGVEGFLQNLDKMYEKSDEDNTAWEAFLNACFEYYGKEIFVVAELTSNAQIGAIFPEELGNPDEKGFSNKLGKALAKQAEVRFPNGLMVTREGSKKSAILWKVECYNKQLYDLYKNGS